MEATDDRVRVEFAAPLERAFLRVEVRDSGGRVISGAARRDPREPRAAVAPLDAPPGPGAVLRWRAMSQDGHVESGSLRPADGATLDAPGPEDRAGGRLVRALVRMALLSGPIAVLGLAVLWLGVLAPVARDGGIHPPGSGADRSRAAAGATHALAPLRRRAQRRVVLPVLVVWGAAVIAWPWAMLGALGAGAGGLGDLLGTRAGGAWLVQAAAVACALGAFAWLRRRPPAAAAVPLATAGAAAAVALVAVSWAGHASTGPDPTANIAIDALHNLATAAWLGGLAGLLVALPALRRELPAGDGVSVVAGVVVRFSALAVAAVTALVVTGVYRALAELSSASDLVTTGYGWALLAKLGLFAALLALGGVNRFVHHPRLERAALGLGDAGAPAAGRLIASVRAELLLSAGVLAAVAVLIGLPPPA